MRWLWNSPRGLGVLLVPLVLLSACGKAGKKESPPLGLSSSASGNVALPPLQPAVRLLEPNSPAPVFALVAHTGMLVRVDRFAPKPVVVFFCPSINDPRCTAPLLSLRDAWLHLRPKVGMVIAVLGEDRIALREYAYAQELPFLLTTDPGNSVSRAYGVGQAGASQVQLFVVSPAMKTLLVLSDPAPDVAAKLEEVITDPQ
jgi:peroxiredoxin